MNLCGMVSEVSGPSGGRILLDAVSITPPIGVRPANHHGRYYSKGRANAKTLTAAGQCNGIVAKARPRQFK
jgi:hypothetical protein